MNYPHLFEPIKIRGRIIKNRIFSAPNMLFQIYQGRPTDYYVGYLEHKARGGAGIVTMGEIPICDGATHTPPAKMTDDNMNIFGEISDAIKEHGALAAVELTHGGRQARKEYNSVPLKGPITEITEVGEYIQAMTEKDMDDVAEAYADSCEYMCNAGFDIAHVHGGHGWLFSQFISPLRNKRTDEYGGSLENRMRFPLMCLERMRQRVGNRMIISLRMSGSERIEGGFTPDDIAEFISKAEKFIDMVEITTEGWEYSMPSSYIERKTNVAFSEAIKKSGKVHIPIYVIGSIVTVDEAEEILAKGQADGISLSRALIADPDLPNKARSGHADDIIPCVRCMNCTDGDNARRRFHCTVNPVSGHETRINYNEQLPKAKYRKKVLVIGGGPAGIMAATTAWERGHDVILCEKSGSLGGTVRYTENDSLKYDLRGYKEYIVRHIGKTGVDVRLNTEVTPEVVEAIKPDHIIIATGATPVIPKSIKGYERAHRVTDIYFSPETAKGDNIVIVGGGLSGVEAGLHLCKEEGKKVVVLEALTSLMGVGTTYGWGVMREMQKHDITVIEHAFVKELTENSVKYELNGEEKEVAADSVFFAVGLAPNNELYYQLYDKALFVDLVGDCRSVGRVLEANESAYYTALSIGTYE